MAPGPLNASLVADVRATAATLDQRGAWLLNYAADNLSAGERALGVLRLRRAIARGTRPERERLEPLLDRARRAKAFAGPETVNPVGTPKVDALTLKWEVNDGRA